jgi:hypothetical protein
MSDTSTETHILISDSEEEEAPTIHPLVPVVQADEVISPEAASRDARKRQKQDKRAEQLKKKRMSVVQKIKKVSRKIEDLQMDAQLLNIEWEVLTTEINVLTE